MGLKELQRSADSRTVAAKAVAAINLMGPVRGISPFMARREGHV